MGISSNTRKDVSTGQVYEDVRTVWILICGVIRVSSSITVCPVDTASMVFGCALTVGTIVGFSRTATAVHTHKTVFDLSDSKGEGTRS